MAIELYHGSNVVVDYPEIRRSRYTKDFSWGFYCTNSYQQAYRWADRRHGDNVLGTGAVQAPYASNQFSRCAGTALPEVCKG